MVCNNQMKNINEARLTQLLRDNGVNMTNDGHICLYDLVTKVIGSKNPTLYMTRLINYIFMTIKGK